MSTPEALSLDHELLDGDERILVACSGGADSVALLLALHEAEYQLGAAHINHGTRGKESDADEDFVRALCRSLNIPFFATKLNLPPMVNEAAMRDARYEALLGCAREYSCRQLATGHTADDVLETLLLNLLRGASALGWGGIPPQRELEGILLVRPLLKISRAQVRAFLKSRGMAWREDSSNDDPKYLRNRVRHELMPKLLDLGGTQASQLARQTARSAQVLRAEFALLDELTQLALHALTLNAPDQLLILDGLKFRELHIALQRRVLRRAALQLDGKARELNFERIEEARVHIMENRRRAVWQWSQRLSVEWTGEHSGQRIRLQFM
jgi:tRNA(Ile)-lysidine synthase